VRASARSFASRLMLTYSFNQLKLTFMLKLP
jgi:hypothetical protein